MAASGLPVGGIVRQLDDLGRIIVPMEVRRMLALDGAKAEFSLRDGREIVMVRAGCAFCGADGAPVAYGARRICRACAAGVKEALDAAAGGP